LAFVVVLRVKFDLTEKVQNAVLPEVADVVGQCLSYRLLLCAVFTERGSLCDQPIVQLKICCHCDYTQNFTHSNVWFNGIISYVDVSFGFGIRS
jgi:hypothetical protein